MSYRVLARTYRSKTFDEVVGQEAIATTLKNAISSGRVHHGYLFTGTRGVGKTSMARILAKALNCLAFDEPTTTPCCVCESCTTVATGEDIDVVEIDAASNTGVDNIRELRSNATLRPARSRFKIYIIDEVHMLSTGAFNALLKILEEPPSHVKFILATTESHKVPATIQSRCQRFDFHAIDATSIAGHLKRILEMEKVKAEESVLKRIGRLANGSMRDALSLLDMVLSYESDNLTASVVDQVIPPPHDELAGALIDCVARSDAPGTLRALDQALQSGRTVDRFCDHLIEHVRTLMLLNLCGADTDLVDAAASNRSQLAEQAEQFDAATYVYMISLLEELRRNVKFSGAARALADAAMVRLAGCRQFSNIDELLRRLESPGAESGGNPPLSVPRSKKNDRVSPAKSATPGAQSVDVPSVGSLPRDPSTTEASETSGSGLVHPPVRVTSRQLDRVSRDPFVERVKQAVEGRILDIRPATKPKSVEASEDLEEEPGSDANGSKPSE